MDPGVGAGRLSGTEPVKYGCDRASAAVIRLAGSNCRSRSSKSRAAGNGLSIIRYAGRKPTCKVPCGDAFGRTCEKGILGYRGYCFGGLVLSVCWVYQSQHGTVELKKHIRTPSLWILRRTRSSGVPMMRIMWRSWSWLSLPRNSGTPEIISAKMQPQDQTSIEVLYVREPMRTSGARYQRVTTSSQM